MADSASTACRCCCSVIGAVSGSVNVNREPSQGAPLGTRTGRFSTARNGGPEASSCEPAPCHNRRPVAAAVGQVKEQGQGPMSGPTRRGTQGRRLKMSSYLRREPWHSGPFEQHEDARHGHRLAAVGGGLLPHDLDSDAWIKVKLVEQELVRCIATTSYGFRAGSGKSLMLNVTSTSAFALTAAARTCLSFESLVIPSINDSYPSTRASGNDRAMCAIRRSTRSAGIPRSIRLRRSSESTSADHKGRYADASARRSKVSQR